MAEQFNKIGVVGAGSMGTMMAPLFAEHGTQISIFDVSKSNVDSAKKMFSKTPQKDKITTFHEDYKAFASSLGEDSENLYVFSITHGSPADQVIKGLKPFLKKGDIILDGGNEHYRNTERRQEELKDAGIIYIGTGVSGGYQSARHGPSMSPSGDQEAVNKIMPLLEKWAAKDKKTGAPCVANIGPKGSGHYVKMVHNGIEQGMLGILNEAWEILFKCMHTDLDEISRIFLKWENEGELKNNFLVSIGSDICLRKKEKGTGHVINEVQDKVVQDADNSEGTGVWTVMEAAMRHVSAPTIAAAHFYRIASANRQERLKTFEIFQGISAAKKQNVDTADRIEVIEDLRLAVYCGFLLSFIQGLNLLARANVEEGWEVKLSECIKIWRAGCIIQSDYISDLLQPILQDDEKITNLLTVQKVAEEIKRTYPSLDRIVKLADNWDAHIPALSASKEYVKYCGGKHLPTQFMEGELDYFGAHSYDLKSEGPGEVKKGSHHYEWRPA